MERPGGESRWNTLRALRILRVRGEEDRHNRYKPNEQT
jgi:hypothetical protein